MKKYRGWWCPWCSTWVDGKDTEVRDDQNFHVLCGNVVDRRSCDVPVVAQPPTADILRQQDNYRDMLSNFIRGAM